MLLLILLFLLIPCSLFPEQLIRETFDLQEGFFLLYRVKDKEALAESKLRFDREGEFTASRFIFETEQFQFGSFTPCGMWKFTAMETLLSSAAIEDRPGLKADRSAYNSLEKPAAAYLLPERGGVFCSTSEDYIYPAIWTSLAAGNYTFVNTGLSCLFPDENPADLSDEEWYGEERLPQNSPLYHGVTEIIKEGSKTECSLIVAVSSASDRIPGCSLLPVFTYYGSCWDLESRFWYNNESWLNSNLERADWETFFENSFSIMLKCGLQSVIQFFSATDYIEETPTVFGLVCRQDLYLSSWSFLLDYSLLSPEYNSQAETQYFFYNHLYRGGGGWHGRVWSSRAEASFRHDEESLLFWKASAELKRAPRRGRYSRLRCSLKSEPGIMYIEPVYEDSFSLGDFNFRLTGGYIFEQPSSESFLEESLRLSISLEWKD